MQCGWLRASRAKTGLVAVRILDSRRGFGQDEAVQPACLVASLSTCEGLHAALTSTKTGPPVRKGLSPPQVFPSSNASDQVVSAHRDIPVIGIIGGIGSGKSAVARELASRRRLAVIDGDRAGHQALLNPAIKHRLHQRFGDAVFDQKGDVIRSALARRVFGTSRDAHQSRADLERIVHPEIRNILAQEIETARNAQDVDAILLDAAVLLEAGWHDLCDAVIFVETPEPIRRNRVLSSRNWTAEQLRQREESQFPLEQKRRAADFVIENSGSLTAAAAELGRVVDQVCQRNLGHSNGPHTP